VTPCGETKLGNELAESVAASFRPLADSDAPKLREGRLRIVAAKGRSLEAVMPGDRAWSLE
jgi:predicted Zn-dependent protease